MALILQIEAFMSLSFDLLVWCRITQISTMKVMISLHIVPYKKKGSEGQQNGPFYNKYEKTSAQHFSLQNFQVSSKFIEFIEWDGLCNIEY